MKARISDRRIPSGPLSGAKMLPGMGITLKDGLHEVVGVVNDTTLRVCKARWWKRLTNATAGQRAADRQANHGADPESISPTEPDWTREYKSWHEWDPGRSLLASIRTYQRASSSPWGKFVRRVCVLRHRWWSIVTGADIPLNCHIGGGLLIPHPNGVVIHPDARIGPNCLIFQQVTLGVGYKEGVPTIGGHVDIGAGAKILGAVLIGDHAKIGANAVVLRDVPEHATAVGIPAKIIG